MDDRLKNLQLVPFNDPIVQTRPIDFDFAAPPIDPLELNQAMLDAMIKLGGVGLSANQVGLPWRMFVYGIAGKYEAVFNPTIVGASRETTIMKEGCLSMPGIWLNLKRPIVVVVSYVNEKNEPVGLELSGITSRVFQHEYDHMEGRNFTQRASPLKLKMALDKLRKKVHHGQQLRAADAA